MKKIGIILADDNEYLPFERWALENSGEKHLRHGRQSVRFSYSGNEITAVYSGVGKVNAAAACAHLISEIKPSLVLNAGLSGAVSDVARGEIIAGASYVECDFDITPTGRKLGEKPSQPYVYTADGGLLKIAANADIRTLPVGTGDFFLTDRALALKYKLLFGIAAFDMESAALASVCHFSQVPFLSIRKISDNADDAAVEDYREMNNKQERDLTEALQVFLAVYSKST